MNKHKDFTETNNAARQIVDSHHDTSTIHTSVDSSIDTAIKAIAKKMPESSITSFLTLPSKTDAFSLLIRDMNTNLSKVSLPRGLQLDQEMKRLATTIDPMIRASLAAQSQINTSLKAIGKSTDKIASVKSFLAKESKLDTLSSLMRSFIQDLKHKEEMMKRATTNIAPMMRVALAAQSQIEVAIPSLRTQLKQLKLQPHLSGIAIDSDVPLQKPPYRNVNKSITSDNESLNLIDYQPPIHEVFRETGWPGRTRAPAIPKGSSLEELLWEINPDLLNLLQGASQALNTGNPDLARHVLRQLAPNDNIRAGNTKPLVLTEGTLDVSYIQTALTLLGKRELLGSLDIEPVNRTHAGGDSWLDRVRRVYKANSSLFHRLILLLYDCDTNKQAEQVGQLTVRSILRNPENTKVKNGIENLFPADLFTDCFYREKPKNDGGFLKQLDKTKFCNWICEERQNPDDFEKFDSIVQILEEFTGTDQPHSAQQE